VIRLGIANLTRPKLTVCAWIAATVVLGVFAVDLEPRLAQPTFIVKGTSSERAFSVRREHFGAGLTFAILLEGRPSEVRRQGVALTRALDRKPYYSALSPWDSSGAAPDLRPDSRTAVVALTVESPIRDASDIKALATAEDVRDLIDERIGGPVHASITGPSTIGLGLQEAALSSTEKAELIAAPLLLIVLLFVFRSVAAAAVPLVIGGASVAAGFGALRLATSFLAVDALATTFASLLGLALGIDYSLLIVSRFREELARGLPRREAASEALRTAGQTVRSAALLLIVGMSVALVVLPGGILFSAALGALTVTAISLVTATLVLPSALLLIGPNINRWPVGRRGDERGVMARVLRHRPAPLLAAVPVVLGLALLAVPATGLRAESPSPELLPDGNRERVDFERFRRRLGPGWGAPFDMTVVARRGSIAKPELLRRLRATQARLARDPEVELVVGAGSLARPLASLSGLPRGLDSLDRALADGKSELGKLDSGLGRASAGADRLNAGLERLSAAGQALRDGNVTASEGAGRLRDGLAAAADGSSELGLGLEAAGAGAGSLRSGSLDAVRGAERMTRALREVQAGVASGRAEASALPAGLRQGSTDLGRLRQPAQIADAQLDAALQKLKDMTIGKADAQYAGLYEAVATASGAVSGRNPQDGSQVAAGYRGLDTELAGAQSALAAAAIRADEAVAGLARLESALTRLAAGSASLGAGIERLRRGAAELDTGIGKLAGGSGDLTDGVRTLSAGADRLSPGVARLAAGSVLLARGLEEGRRGSGRLGAGMRVIDGGVSEYGDSLPDTGGLARLRSQSPGLFESGYFALAAIDGAPAGRRNAAAFTVDVDGGGQAGSIVVLPKRGVEEPATGRLRDRLENEASGLERTHGITALVGGVAAQSIDSRDKTMSRVILLFFLLSALSYVLLVIVLRSLVLPLVAVVLNLLTIGAMMGILALLFEGSTPLLGGPGYIDTLSLTGTFTVTFALSIDYEVFLLTRMREGYLRSGSTEQAIAYGLDHTARIVTGAAAIMVAVFAAFSVTEFHTIRVLGVGLAAAIVIDATLVRLFLLPAIMRRCGRLNWWLPSWLDRLLPAVSVEPRPRPALALTAFDGDQANGPAPVLVPDRSNP
jgi:RND superfamily putative drug exporter